MNNGLKILIERMKTNPEEFRLGYRAGGKRWNALIEEYWEIFTDEEKAQYQEALREVRLGMFEEEVLKELMRDESGTPRVVDYQERMRIGSDGNVGVGTGRQLTLPLVYTQEK